MIRGSILRILIIVLLVQSSVQNCTEEISKNGLIVKWPVSQKGYEIISEPLCYNDKDEIITRNCSGEIWLPTLDDLETCTRTVINYDLESCPPGFFSIFQNDSNYCYELSEPTSWNYPCFESGGASVITDLSVIELNALVEKLQQAHNVNYTWLPGRREEYFNPAVWTIPGPHWGKDVIGSKTLPIENSIRKNCLAFDIRRKSLFTTSCTDLYPNLCFYINNFIYQARCPNGYIPFRYIRDEGVCIGIERTDDGVGLNFKDFLETKCEKPLGQYYEQDSARFFYAKMSDALSLPEDEWCWFGSVQLVNNSNFGISVLQDKINYKGSLALSDSVSLLTCMACEKDLIYDQTELLLDYNSIENQLHLLVYYPSGLWKYVVNDSGVNCFSNANGFNVPVDISEIQDYSTFVDSQIDKERRVFEIQLISKTMSQYWCEGHTKNLTHIITPKVTIKPEGNEEHVFALVIRFYNFTTETSENPDFEELTFKLSNIITAKKVIIMSILELTSEYMETLIHLHVTLHFNETNVEGEVIKEKLEFLKEEIIQNIPQLNATFVSISSSLYCLAISSDSENNFDWELTSVGQITAPQQFCLQKNGLPVKRKCLGSYLLGAEWGPVEGNCDDNYEPSNTTTFLYNFIREKTNSPFFLTEGLHFVLDNPDIIIPADIYYLSVSLKQISLDAKNNKSLLEMSELETITWAMDRLAVLDCSYLNLAQTLNSTNVILDSMSDIIDSLATFNNTNFNKKISSSKSKSMCYQLSVKPRFLLQITYPYCNKISGLALVRNSSSSYFSDMVVIPLYSNTTYDYALNIENLEIATWLPEEVIDSMKLLEPNSTSQTNGTQYDSQFSEKNDMHIIISIFYNDAIFQEVDPRDHRVNSLIVEVALPGYVSEWEKPLPLIFRDNVDVQKDAKFCAFWDFETHKMNETPGSWKDSGCFLVNNSNGMTICECYHLTHFAQLINVGKILLDIPIAKKHSFALNIITIVGSFLSLVGILGIWITAMTFVSWRRKPGTKVLIQLSIAIAIPLVLIMYFNLDKNIFFETNGVFRIIEDKKPLCIILGALLHYSILAGFMWMLIIAILQFIRYVRVFGVSRQSRFLIRLSIIGWTLPSLPVIIVLIVNRFNYIPSPNIKELHSGICYPTGLYLILAVLLPVSLILIINVVLFVYVMVSISRGPDGKMKTSDYDLIKTQLRLSTFLFFLLGLTWIFGIFSFTQGVWWSYLFCLTSTFQGFVLFIYFVVCDENTRTLWTTLIKPQFRFTSSRESITSISNIMQ